MQAEKLCEEIRACRICSDWLAATYTGHQPRPVAWFSGSARLSLASPVLAQYRMVETKPWFEAELLPVLPRRVKELMR